MAHTPAAFSSKFDAVVVPLHRRRPPSPLRLVEGPLPPRNKPKHTLPSLPRPAFNPKVHIVTAPGPKPRRRVNSQADLTEFMEDPVLALTKGNGQRQGPRLRLSIGDGNGHGGSTPSSEGSLSPSSSRSSLSDMPLRGPWDHSGCIKVPIDLATLLTPPRPVAVNPGLVR